MGGQTLVISVACVGSHFVLVEIECWRLCLEARLRHWRLTLTTKAALLSPGRARPTSVVVISGEALLHGVGLWQGSLPLVRWEKWSQSDPTEFELGETVRSKGPITVRTVAPPALAPMGFVRARCQKWVNIKLYLIKNRKRQSSPYLLQGAKVNWMVFGSRWLKSHSLMTQPKKYSKLVWNITACFYRYAIKHIYFLLKKNYFSLKMTKCY